MDGWSSTWAASLLHVLVLEGHRSYIRFLAMRHVKSASGDLPRRRGSTFHDMQLKKHRHRLDGRIAQQTPIAD